MIVQEELLERAAELSATADALETARAGDGSLLVFEGPAGIGKTRLLEAARAAAEARGFRVHAARGGELERDFAYGVVGQLFERAVMAAAPEEREALLSGAAVHAGAAIGLRAAQDGPTADDQSFAVRHGLYWLVANLAASGPLLLAIDDVQWADAASLRFLAYLAPRLEGLPVLVAMTARTGDLSTDAEVLAGLTIPPAALNLSPSPLSAEGTAAMLAARIEGPVEAAFAAACHAATGGSPFLLGELAAVLLDDRIDPVAENAGRVGELGPRTVARSVLLRLGRVSPETVRFARVVSVLGASADLRHAASLAGLGEDAARRSYDALAASGVLAPERPLRFAHPILREAVYRDLPPAERDALHAGAARVLLAAQAPASAVAAHLLATPPEGSEQSVASLRAAARVALGQGAADLAARYLRRALEEPPPDAARGAVLGELGRAEGLSGEDPLSAIGHLRAALAATSAPAARTDLVIALARALASTGDVTSAAAVVADELATQRDASRDEVLLLEAELGSIRLLHDARPEYGERLMRFADLPGDTIPELLVLSNAGVWHWVHGTEARCAELAERSLGGGRAVAAVGGDSIAVLQAAYVLGFAERHDVAVATLEACVEGARRTGSLFAYTATRAELALLAYLRGDLQRCEAEARAAMSLPTLPPFVHPSAHTYLALALVERGELEEAEAVVERSWIGPHLPVLVHMNPAFYARARLRIAQGRADEALEDLRELGARDARTFVMNPGFPWRALAARLLAARGEGEEALRLADEHLGHARRWGTPGAIGVALHARALVTGGGPPALAEAVAVLERSRAQLDHAHALVDLGAARRAAGAPTEAQADLRAGLDLARACGATALVRRAHQELLIAGARPRRLQFSGAEALTASERRICELAAGGRSNREIAQELFITPKTVENHLGRAYVKLGIGSRDRLGAVLGDGPAKDEGSRLMR